MAIKFNQTSSYDGLVQRYEREIGANYGDISGNTVKLREFTARCNSAVDRYFDIAIQASGTWELDDSNHTDYAVIYANIVSGQRDYSFTTDENGNLIKDIYKVLILPNATETTYDEVYPVDENDSANLDIIDEENTAGIPIKYAKRSNAIHFGGAVFDYNATRGIKILINREPTRFLYTDTTKTPGFPYYHEYFFLRPALEEARIQNLASYNKIMDEVIKLDGEPLNGKVGLISKAYGRRKKDESDVISGEYINSK